jgi:signal transduction histidine kinase
VDGGEPVEVVADADRIGQVVANFVTNALKYSPDDQPIHVRVQRKKHDVRVSVHDHGPGLPPEEQVRVWELFHRAPGVNVQSDLGLQSSGLGLGLHICKRIVELHLGGKVGIDSAAGEGSTFWFQLPLASSAEGTP